MTRNPVRNLAVVPTESEPPIAAPPGKLDDAGMALWRSVVSAYEFADAASYMILFQACGAVERAERCRAIIDSDGEMIRVGKVLRSHPLLRDEVANRALGCRLLARLGLDLEPLRGGPGRPPGR
jgi:hypothetical protein